MGNRLHSKCNTRFIVGSDPRKEMKIIMLECKRRQSPTKITEFGRFMTNSTPICIWMLTNSASQDMQLAFITHNCASLDSKD